MIERFDPSTHFPLVDAWYARRGLPTTAGVEDMFPACGAVSDGCAAAWLYTTGTSIAYVDNLITDPDVDRARRYRATRDLFAFLGDEAERAGVRMIIAATRRTLPIAALEGAGFATLDTGLHWLVRARS